MIARFLTRWSARRLARRGSTVRHDRIIAKMNELRAGLGLSPFKPTGG